MEDCEIEQDNSLEINSDKVSVKKNKTVMYKLKKRVLHLGKIFTSGINNYIYIKIDIILLYKLTFILFLDSKKKNAVTQLSADL